MEEAARPHRLRPVVRMKHSGPLIVGDETVYLPTTRQAHLEGSWVMRLPGCEDPGRGRSRFWCAPRPALATLCLRSSNGEGTGDQVVAEYTSALKEEQGTDLVAGDFMKPSI